MNYIYVDYVDFDAARQITDGWLDSVQAPEFDGFEFEERLSGLLAPAVKREKLWDPGEPLDFFAEIDRVQAQLDQAGSPADAVYVLDGKVFEISFKIPQPRPVISASDPYAMDFDRIPFTFSTVATDPRAVVGNGFSSHGFSSHFYGYDCMDMPHVERVYGEPFFERKAWRGY